MSSYCIFSALYLPSLGGVERYTLNLAKKLRDAGHKVTIVTSNLFGMLENEQQDGLEIIRIPCLNLLNGRFPLIKPNAEFRKLSNELGQKHFDFAIVQTRFYVHSLFGVRFIKKHGIAGLVIEHGTGHFTVNNPVLDRIGAVYEHLISGLVRLNCPNIYGVSQACCKWSEHFHFKPRGVLYNSIEPKDIEQLLAHPAEYYRRKHKLEGKPIVTYSGRLVKEKGILKLIEAVRILQSRGIDVHLMIAGDGEMRKVIEIDKPDYIHLLGRLDFSHVIALLKDTDIFCLPTDYPEGFPTSVLEAAACKNYIVTTNKGGSKELILDGTYGAILKENTPEEIAQVFMRAINEPDYRHSAIDKTYRRLNEFFTWDYTANRVMQIAKEAYHD